jgi:hypothetical protein
MTQYYSYHKGKYGGTAGYIFPFFTALTGTTPDENYATYVPAGFLKCQGQILPANRYRALANVIGVGSSCIYRKEGTELDNADENGEGGEIQLPDLGSKYIAGASNPGQYQNITVASDDSIERAGIGVEIFSLSDSIDFFYTGNFKAIQRTTAAGTLSVSGNVTSVSPPSRTEKETLLSSNFLPHAHNSTFKVGRRVNRSDNGIRSATFRNCYYCRSTNRAVTSCNADTNFGYEFKFITLLEEGTESAATHLHTGALPRITNESKTASMSEVLIPSASLTTNVKIRTNEKVKLDEFAPKYILCEYLIKY